MDKIMRTGVIDWCGCNNVFLSHLLSLYNILLMRRWLWGLNHVSMERSIDTNLSQSQQDQILARSMIKTFHIDKQAPSPQYTDPLLPSTTRLVSGTNHCPLENTST